MKLSFFLYFYIFILFSCETEEKDTSAILARVSGEKLTIKKAQKLNNGNPLNKENIPRLVLDWVDNTVLLKKGKELGLQNDSVLLRKRDVFFNNLIISSFFGPETGSKNKCIKKRGFRLL